MRGLIFPFFFAFDFPGHFWKTNLGSGEAGWQMNTFCQRPHYSKQHELCLGKKKGFLVKLVAEAKIQLLGKENGSCRASLGLMASLKYFSFCAPDFVPSSRLFTCQRNRVLRCRPGCTCKMFPIVFLLFVPVLVPLLLCRDEWRPRRGLRDAEGTGLDYWKLVSSSALQKETQKVSCWTY